MGQVMTKQETIEEITRRLVEFYQPVRIYRKRGVMPARQVQMEARTEARQ